jgi:hypothetical protein
MNKTKRSNKMRKMKRSNKMRKTKRSNKKSVNKYNMYRGSRFSSPYCPGISVYEDDTSNGGKKCKRPDYENPGESVIFKIDKDGHCAEPEDQLSKCATTATGAVLTAANAIAGGTKFVAATIGRGAVKLVGKDSEYLSRLQDDAAAQATKPNSYAKIQIKNVSNTASNAVNDLAKFVSKKR